MMHDDYKNVASEAVYLPTDLKMMLSFMCKKTVQKEIRERVIRNLDEIRSYIPKKEGLRKKG